MHDKINFHSTSRSETFSIKKYCDKHIFQIQNLPGSSCSSKLQWKKEGSSLRIIYISRIRDNKNLIYALKVLKNIINFKITFNIYGPIEDFKYWDKCNVIINKLPENIECKYQGIALPKDVPKIMSNYHILFFPTKTENFGHVIVEAMQVGLIPLISDQTPWNDLQNFNAGWAINLKNSSEFVKILKIINNYDFHDFENIINNVKNYIKEKIDPDIISKGYDNMYTQLLK